MNSSREFGRSLKKDHSITTLYKIKLFKKVTKGTPQKASGSSKFPTMGMFPTVSSGLKVLYPTTASAATTTMI